MSIKTKLIDIIYDSIQKNDITFEKDGIIIEIPKNEENGDYSTNIALILTRTLHDNPMNIAEKIVSAIDSPLIEEVQVAKPGFINFKINKKYFYFSKKSVKIDIVKNRNVCV